MRQSNRLLLLFLVTILGIVTANAAWFSNLMGKQTVAYIGIGNENEELAFAYYQGTGGTASVEYTLYGD